MDISAFEMGEELKMRTISYKLHRRIWEKYDFSTLNLNFHNWTTIKYLNNDGTDFNENINQLPNDLGGIYLFSIRCPIILGCTQYPVYIGRALITQGQNLRKRCREYFTKYSKDGERPKITTLFKYWSNDLYLSFLTIEENNEIIDLEKKLINSLLLPFNDVIPDQQIRQSVKAFQI